MATDELSKQQSVENIAKRQLGEIEAILRKAHHDLTGERLANLAGEREDKNPKLRQAVEQLDSLVADFIPRLTKLVKLLEEPQVVAEKEPSLTVLQQSLVQTLRGQGASLQDAKTAVRRVWKDLSTVPTDQWGVDNFGDLLRKCLATCYTQGKSDGSTPAP